MLQQTHDNAPRRHRGTEEFYKGKFKRWKVATLIGPRAASH